MSLALTLAQEFRVSTPDFDANEFRVTNAGTFNAFKKQTAGSMSFITDELKARAMNSTGNTLKIPAINYKDVTIRTTRPLTIAADENTSTFYTVTFATLAYGFVMYPTRHINNDVSYQLDFNKKFKAMLVKMMSTLEGQAVAAVDAKKTQVIGEVTGGHTFAANVVSELNIGNWNSSYILTDLGPMMRSNDFEPHMMDVVGNQSLGAILNRMDGFAAYNSENKTIQYLGKNFGFSNSITNAAGKIATGYAIEDGSLGLLSRVELDSLARTSVADGHKWDMVNVPGIDLDFGSYYYEAAIDASSVDATTTHLTRTKAQYFDWAIDVGWVTKYNSDLATIPSPIIKFDIDTDNT